MSGEVFRKYLSILFKTIFDVFPWVTWWRVVVFVFLIKKGSLCSWGELRLTWKNYFHESFPWFSSSFSFWGESVNRNSIIMISKGYYYVINLGISSNFVISIDLVYPGSLLYDILRNEKVIFQPSKKKKKKKSVEYFP